MVDSVACDLIGAQKPMIWPNRDNEQSKDFKHHPP